MRHEFRETAAEAFQRVNWRLALPRLVEHAERCMRIMGWVESGTRRPAVIEASELVNQVVEAFLLGDREWPPKAQTEDEIIAILCMTIRSATTNRRTSADIARRERSTADREAKEECAETTLHARQVIGLVAKEIEDDPEMVALLRALPDGGTREDLATALEWTEQRVKLVRGRMTDRLKRRGITRHGRGDA